MNAVQDRAATDQKELVSILQEESSNLKAKMIQLTEENNKLKKDKAKLTHSAAAEHREQIERQKEEIRTLKEQLSKQSSEKGLKLLAALQGVGSSPDASQNAGGAASQAASMREPKST